MSLESKVSRMMRLAYEAISLDEKQPSAKQS
jgi:hypothetical protein